MNYAHLPEKVFHLMVKKLVTKKNHPYTHFALSFIEKMNKEKALDRTTQVTTFFNNVYRGHSMTVAVAGTTKIVDNKSVNPFEVVKKEIKAISEGKSSSNFRPGTTSVIKSGLPFENLPQIFFYRNKENNTLRVTSQISTSYDEEAKYEGVKFISFILERLLRGAFHENHLVHEVSSYSEYFPDFALLHIRAEISEQGLDKVETILSTIVGAIQEVRNNNDERVYLRAKNILFAIYNSQPVMSPKELAIEFARRTPKFGFKYAFRATKTLNDYNHKAIKKIMDQLTPENLLVTVSGDFSIDIQGAFKNKVSQPIDLNYALKSRITREFHYSARDSKTKERRGSITLDTRLILHGAFLYNKQKISQSYLQRLVRLGKETKFKDTETAMQNPYALSMDFIKAEMSPEKLATLQTEKGFFGREDNTVKEDSSNMLFYYRQNYMFPLKRIYLNLRFISAISVPKTLSLTTSLLFQQTITTRIWNRRLALMRAQLREFSGEVLATHNTEAISLDIYAPESQFEKVFDEVLKEIDFKKKPVEEREFTAALLDCERELMKGNFDFNTYQQKFEAISTKFAFYPKDMLKYLQTERNKLEKTLQNPGLVFGYAEGAINSTQAEKYLNKTTAKFKVSKVYASMKDSKLMNFMPKTTLLLRYRTSDQDDPRALVGMNVDLGKVSILNYALSHIYRVLIRTEAKIYFIDMHKVAFDVKTRVSRISNHLVLQVIVESMEPVEKIEKLMNNLMGYVELSCHRSIHPALFRKLIAATIRDMRDEKRSVLEYGREDARDIFLSYGKYMDLRERAINLLKEHITLQDTRNFLKEQIIKGSKVYFEFASRFSNKPGFKSAIGEQKSYIEYANPQVSVV